MLHKLTKNIKEVIYFINSVRYLAISQWDITEEKPQSYNNNSRQIK